MNENISPLELTPQIHSQEIERIVNLCIDRKFPKEVSIHWISSRLIPLMIYPIGQSNPTDRNFFTLTLLAGMVQRYRKVLPPTLWTLIGLPPPQILWEQIIYAPSLSCTNDKIRHFLKLASGYSAKEKYSTSHLVGVISFIQLCRLSLLERGEKVSLSLRGKNGILKEFYAYAKTQGAYHKTLTETRLSDKLKENFTMKPMFAACFYTEMWNYGLESDVDTYKRLSNLLGWTLTFQKEFLKMKVHRNAMKHSSENTILLPENLLEIVGPPHDLKQILVSPPRI